MHRVKILGNVFCWFCLLDGGGKRVHGADEAAAIAKYAPLGEVVRGGLGEGREDVIHVGARREAGLK